MEKSNSVATASNSADLTCLLYISTHTRECSDKELKILLDHSRSRNSELDVTGLLIYCQQHFLQVLEGSKAAVEQTYERIKEDPRHKNLKIMVNDPVDRRFFPDWSMAYKQVFDSDRKEAASVQKILNSRDNGPMKTVKNLFEIFQDFLD